MEQQQGPNEFNRESAETARPPALKPITNATGPRTKTGKERSRYNALKAGIFSQSVFLKHESRRQYELLLNGYRNYFRPNGTFEDQLVDKLAMLDWRRQRLVRAEGGKIAGSVQEEAISSHKKFLTDRAKPRFGKGTETSSALFSQTSDTDIFPIARSTLQSLRDRLAAKGWESINPSAIRSLYATEEEKEEEDGTVPRSIYGTLDFLSRAARLAREGDKHIESLPSPEALKTVALRALDYEIWQLEFQRITFRHFKNGRRPAEFAGALVLSKEDVDRFARYESHLSREFERTLNQLERHQRMRLGQSVPPAIKVDVSG